MLLHISNRILYVSASDCLRDCLQAVDVVLGIIFLSSLRLIFWTTMLLLRVVVENIFWSPAPARKRVTL